MSWIDMLVLVIYFVAMAAMGPYFARKNKTTENYFLGGRSFPGWLIGLSMFATSISSITFVAYPADAYKTAYLRFLPCLMLPLGIFLASKIFLPFYRRAHITSAFEYLEVRFGSGTRAYAATAFVIGQVTRLGMILYLVSMLVQEMTGLNAYYSILLGGVITSFYTITGGIEAVIWTDFFQSFLLWFGGFAILVIIIMNVDGGLSTIISVAAADGKFMLGDLDTATGELVRAPRGFSLVDKTVLMMLLVGLTNWLTEYSSNQNVIQKYVATKDPKNATQAIWICCLCSVPTWAFFMFLGTALYVYFKLNPDPSALAMLDGTARADSIVPYFVIQKMPVGLSGLVIAGVLAAAMSSLSSSINAISAVTIVDIYKRHVAKDKSERHYMRAARVVSLVASVLMLGFAIVLLSATDKTLQDTATKLAAILGGGLLGLYFLGFLTRRGDGRAVGVAIVCTLAFSLWLALVEMKVIEGVVPFETYYGGLVANLIMFVVAYLLGCALFPTRRDLTNLTVWTQTAEWKSMEE
ncbi:MAG TPA: sodium/solute symporter [Candidatus Hydrogenedentes bacterium]|nr:sodium/solute symporter [Candidatus Hydrogenedentota bacterium]HPV39421.1 sodium/solute symporter [Candidatus Hydrogenedentota bacterium]HQM32278.1 sodium/solute symporter [Candidatus Hydrogenedentota bacterium]